MLRTRTSACAVAAARTTQVLWACCPASLGALWLANTGVPLHSFIVTCALRHMALGAQSQKPPRRTPCRVGSGSQCCRPTNYTYNLILSSTTELYISSRSAKYSQPRTKHKAAA